MWVLVFGGTNFSTFFRSNDFHLDVLHDEIKLNNEVANFRQPVLERLKLLMQNNCVSIIGF